MSRVDEIFDGRRCAVCEQPFGADDAGVPVAGRAERMHRDAPDGCPSDPFWTGCTDDCPDNCTADHRGEE